MLAEPALWASTAPLRLRTAFIKSNHWHSTAKAIDGQLEDCMDTA
jgi:hypothetical protein